MSLSYTTRLTSMEKVQPLARDLVLGFHQWFPDVSSNAELCCLGLILTCYFRRVDPGGVHQRRQGASRHHGDAHQDDGSFPRPRNHYQRPKEEHDEVRVEVMKEGVAREMTQVPPETVQSELKELDRALPRRCDLSIFTSLVEGSEIVLLSFARAAASVVRGCGVWGSLSEVWPLWKQRRRANYACGAFAFTVP